MGSPILAKFFKVKLMFTQAFPPVVKEYSMIIMIGTNMIRADHMIYGLTSLL